MVTVPGPPQPCDGLAESEGKFLGSDFCFSPLKSYYLPGFHFHHLPSEAVEFGELSDPFET